MREDQNMANGLPHSEWGMRYVDSAVVGPAGYLEVPVDSLRGRAAYIDLNLKCLVEDYVSQIQGWKDGVELVFGVDDADRFASKVGVVRITQDDVHTIVTVPEQRVFSDLEDALMYLQEYATETLEGAY